MSCVKKTECENSKLTKEPFTSRGGELSSTPAGKAAGDKKKKKKKKRGTTKHQKRISKGEQGAIAACPTNATVALCRVANEGCTDVG